MTPPQKAQFNQSGCISRSLLKLFETKNGPMSADDYCKQFHDLFPNPLNQYGGILTSQIADVIRGLKLGSHFEAFRRYGEIDDWFNNKKKSVLVFSEINLNPGATDIIRHCSLLTAIDAGHFSVICPSTDGKDHQLLPFTANDWDTKICLGIVII